MILVALTRIKPGRHGDPASVELTDDEVRHAVALLACLACCALGCLVRHGAYSRGLVYTEGALSERGTGSLTVVRRRVTVCRVRRRCGKKGDTGRTHALFWFGIVPYSQYSVKTLFLAKVLLDSRTVRDSVVGGELLIATRGAARRLDDDGRLAEALECALRELPRLLREASADAARLAERCREFVAHFRTTPFSRVRIYMQTVDIIGDDHGGVPNT